MLLLQSKQYMMKYVCNQIGAYINKLTTEIKRENSYSDMTYG